MNQKPTAVPLWVSMGSAVLLAACGGGGGGGGGGGTLPPPATTTLTVSKQALALSVNQPLVSPSLSGTPRAFTITNTGTVAAQTLSLSVLPALPTGTTLTTNCPVTLGAGASCLITVTPGATASAAAGDTSPVPSVLRVVGSNTNALTPSVQVLGHGSVYQGGYVYAIDDTTANTGSVGGRVIALTDASPGVVWSSNGNSGATGDVVYNAVPGINENSTPGVCHGGTDGACNSVQINTFYTSVNRSYYAAGVCSATQQGYSDWYLPSVCELGGRATAGCVAGGDNVQTNLVDSGAVGVSGLPHSLPYWASTQTSANPQFQAWSHVWNTGTGLSGVVDKSATLPVRCARALTP